MVEKGRYRRRRQVAFCVRRHRHRGERALKTQYVDAAIYDKG